MSTPSLNLSKIEPIFEGVEPDNSIGETNPRWTAVENYVVPHLQPSSRPYHVALEHAVQNSRARGLKDIAVAASQGKFLAVQCQLLGAKHILEVGTLGAYSAIWMASAGPDVHVTTIEIDGAIAAIARENIKFAGFEDRIQVIVGDALDLLPKLMKKFSKSSLSYFNFAVEGSACEGSASKACILIDNVMRKGLVASEALSKQDVNVAGVRRAVEAIGKDHRIDAVILQVVGDKSYDGFLMAVVK